MYRNIWLISAVCFSFLAGCATKQKTVPTTTSEEKPIVQSVKSADGLIEGAIIGTPATGSKFAKLQIGMTMSQVEKLIGKPSKIDSRITGKQFQSFHFGGDTQRTEAFYENEGHLTFSNTLPDSPADTLIKIKVYSK
jgi:hypothetical protein